jgi:CheY-like chemotaxis protein
LNTNRIFFIADDDPDDQELFIQALQELDEYCTCETALNGEEALAKLNNTSILPSLIFLDLNMPRINGKECLINIKKNERLLHIPVIIYSTSAHQKDIDETIQLGAAFFFQKPNRFEELSRSLNNIIFRNWE